MATLPEWNDLVPPPRPLEGGQSWHVFLSYRSANRAWAVNLYDVLRRYGHKVFLDQCALTAGDELITRLEEALRASQSGVLIWSDATRDSAWVRKEYQVMERHATRSKAFRFVPLKLDQSELPDFADNRIFLDFNGYPDGPNGGELLRLLYAVVGQPLSDAAAHFALELDEASRKAAAQIAAATRNGRPEQLVDLAQNGALPWRVSAVLGAKTAEALTKLGANDAAIALLDDLQREFPRAIRPRQLKALALTRIFRKDPDASQQLLADAQMILGELYETGERDPETLGIYGSTWMERYRRSRELSDLKQSRDYYAEAFAVARDDYYTGINAAAKSVLLGTEEDLSRASVFAGEVQKIVGPEPRKGDYWLTATVAEVLLIQKRYEEAARVYDAAVSGARQEIDSHRSTWTQACNLMAKLQPTPEERALVRRVFEHLPDCGQL